MFIFDYLSQFWNQISDASANTVAWFQSVGNAVAGALGYIILTPLQAVVDFGLALSWIFSNLINIIVNFLSPLKFLAVFFSQFLNSILSISNDPQTGFVFDSNALAIITGIIPLWSVLSSVLAGIIVLAGVITTIKTAKL